MTSLDDELRKLADQYAKKEEALIHSLFAKIISDRVDGRTPRQRWDRGAISIAFQTFCMERGIDFDPNPGWLERLTARQEARKHPFDPDEENTVRDAARAACFEVCRAGFYPCDEDGSRGQCEGPEYCKDWASFMPKPKQETPNVKDQNN